MYSISEDMTIYLTRGDTARLELPLPEERVLNAGDVIRFSITEKDDCSKVVLQKDFGIEAQAQLITVSLETKDTRIGELISKPAVYWYEIELNPFTEPETLYGYNENGPSILMLMPEAAEIGEEPIEPEDIPVVDSELDLTSKRPVENQAIAREFALVRTEQAQAEENANEYTDESLKKAKAYTDDEVSSITAEGVGAVPSSAKPSGTYEGNSGADRVLDLGEKVSGKAVIISAIASTEHNVSAIVTANGAVAFDMTTATVNNHMTPFGGAATFDGRYLTFAQYSRLNRAGNSYSYQVI